MSLGSPQRNLLVRACVRLCLCGRVAVCLCVYACACVRVQKSPFFSEISRLFRTFFDFPNIVTARYSEASNGYVPHSIAQIAHEEVVTCNPSENINGRIDFIYTNPVACCLQAGVVVREERQCFRGCCR
jgi:hypothetical protein